MDYEALHWTALKKLVVEAGGVWTNKDDAIEYLTGLSIAIPESIAKPAEKPAGKPASATLDKSLPYGEVSGKIENAPGARYTQGGVYFNGNGEQVG